MSGAIPPELGGLENLESLNLYSNNLTGEIPAELGDLGNLTTLDLNGSRLTGEIPTQSCQGIVGRLVDPAPESS